jgi:hypothetical protein
MLLVLREGVQVALSVLIGEEMEVAHAVLERSCPGNGEYLLQALLKISEQTEDTVVLYGSFEGTDLLHEDLIEVALEVTHLVQEVVLVE